MRALVVEDEAALREGLREQLVKQGFTVDVAADGEEGLFAGNEYPLDIAVVDLGLPKLSGPRADPQAAHRRQDFSRSSSSRRATAGRTRSKDCRPAPTTTSPSLITSRKCWRACRR